MKGFPSSASCVCMGSENTRCLLYDSMNKEIIILNLPMLATSMEVDKLQRAFCHRHKFP